MAIYDTLFSQLDVTSSQLLVTDRDFRDPSFGHQLRETVVSLLDLKVIPVFNENDAISTRRVPYEIDQSRRRLRVAALGGSLFVRFASPSLAGQVGQETGAASAEDSKNAPADPAKTKRTYAAARGLALQRKQSSSSSIGWTRYVHTGIFCDLLAYQARFTARWVCC